MKSSKQLHQIRLEPALTSQKLDSYQPTHGGYRKGAGRKTGFAAKQAEEARRYISHRLAEEIEPLVEVLLAKAKGGDMRAVQILLDRAWGKPRQELEVTNVGLSPQKPTERILSLARRLNS